MGSQLLERYSFWVWLSRLPRFSAGLIEELKVFNVRRLLFCGVLGVLSKLDSTRPNIMRFMI